MTFSNLTNEEWFSLNSHKFDSETYNRIKSLLDKATNQLTHHYEDNVSMILEQRLCKSNYKVLRLTEEILKLKRQLNEPRTPRRT